MSEDDVTGEQKTTTRMVAGAMIRSMYQYGGVGLAAQQVGFPGAMFVTDAQWPISGRHKPKIFINPNVRAFGSNTIAIEMGEGCLSVPYPGTRQKVERADTITVEWRDLNWEMHEETFEGTEAIVMQHEIDHLHGNLYFDHLSRLKQDVIKRKIKKIRREYMRGFKAAQREVRMAGELKGRVEKRRKGAKK
jgi:peptide deformylase